MSNEATSAAAERYLWLRDGKSIHGGYCGSAPFVMSPRKSRLYAIHNSRGAALDAEIDEDIYENKIDELHRSREVVERGLLPAGSQPTIFDEPYLAVLYKLAQKELGWPDERIAAFEVKP